MLFQLDIGILAANATIKSLLSDRSPVSKELKDAGRIGGYLCLARSSDGLPLLVAAIGKPDPEKSQKYFEFCQEKARRLARNPDHNLSLESADDALNQFPGAVRGIDEIDSFSGLPGRLDEVVSAKVLFARGKLSGSGVLERLSGNPYIERLGVEFFRTLPAI